VKNRLAIAALALAVAAAVHLATIWALPRLIVAVVLRKLPAHGILHAPLPDARWRTIVMPSPDLLYSACAFDVGEQPLLITALVPDAYWSVSLYADDTDNFFALDDRRAPPAGQVRLIVAREGAEVLALDAVVVRAPSRRGLAIFRQLVTDRAQLPSAERVQRAARCEALQ
jgi:uncharacterized membrane protein